jgi:hypothetical protein
MLIGLVQVEWSVYLEKTVRAVGGKCLVWDLAEWHCSAPWRSGSPRPLEAGR